MNKKTLIKPVIFVILIIIIVFSIKYWNITRYFELEYIKTQLQIWQQQLIDNTWLFILGYFVLYIVVVTCSIPGATVLTVVGGALFGFWKGTVIVSVASTIGATLLFLIVRFFLKDSIQKKFRIQYEKINYGVQKNGAFFLFALRLVPIFPFFVINVLMGLTEISLLTYMWVSQLGMLAGTMVYVNMGKQLLSLSSISGLLNPQLWGAFILLAIFPFVSRKILRWANEAKAYKGFQKPTKFDANIVVIGAGSGGLIAAYIATTLKATVYLVEKNQMGGDCLNRGCVPSKALIHISKYADMYQHVQTKGIKYTPPVISFREVMKQVHHTIAKIAPHDSTKRYKDLGVHCIKGEAKIISPWEVQVKQQVIKTKTIIVATGGVPIIPDIPGLSTSKVFTSDTIWECTKAPESMIIIGGGPIGCEMASAFARLGTIVSIVHRGTRLLPKEEPEASEVAQQSLEALGVTILLNAHPTEVRKGQLHCIQVQQDNNTHELQAESIFVAVGRTANLTHLTNGSVNITLNEQGFIDTDEYLRTNIPNIFALGDVIGVHQFTHMASHMAWYATVNALFGKLKQFPIDYTIVPSVIFLSSEIARVGITEETAERLEKEYEVHQYSMSELDRAIIEEDTSGFIKVIVEKSTDRILGATVVSSRGGEILGEFIVAMKHNIGLNKLLSTIHPYPTYIEGVKSVAGVWKKNHVPKRILNILQRIFYIGLGKTE